MATKIDKAVEWAINIANDSSHGYDQGNRWGPDYDCSSLVISAYEHAGVPVKSKGATYTGNMYKVFTACGFADVTKQVNLSSGSGLKKGDVLLHAKNHTEMCISGSQIVGATISEKGTIYGEDGDQTGNEIRIRNYYNYPWQYVLRYPAGSSDSTLPTVTKDQVIAKNNYLTMGEMKINATYVAQYLMSKGWTIESISAILGNMQSESNINPALWESLDAGNTSNGYGLVQWTPATKLIEWCEDNSRNYTDIDAQLDRILYELENNIQWIPTETYPMTFKEFVASDESVEMLANVFMYNYERPASLNQPVRGTQARYWYNYLGDIDPEWKPTYKTKSKSMSLLLMYLATRK